MTCLGCGPSPAVRPLPPPVTSQSDNRGDPSLPTLEIRLTTPYVDEVPLVRKALSRSNITWLGPIQRKPPDEPYVFFVEIGRPRINRSGHIAMSSQIVVNPIDYGDKSDRYRTSIQFPWEPGDYRLLLREKSTMLVDIPITIAPAFTE